MTSNSSGRKSMNVVLQMVMTLIIAILLGQLWLFTVTLEVMETSTAPIAVTAAAVACSLIGCGSVWMLIRFFLRTERSETER